MSQLSTIGVIGLAVMGKNLAKNIASREIQTSVYNRSYEKTEELLAEQNGNLVGFNDIKAFVASLQTPRTIILMVKSGPAVDAVIAELYPLLSEDDIIVDGGNSNWQDTERRQKQLENGSFVSLSDVLGNGSDFGKKINFIGCGISGGEEGALYGPSIMPGGNKEVVDGILPILQKIAAKDFTGLACVTNVGTGASGHFVKMVHNGIEYALMQGIAEVYDVLRKNGQSTEEIRQIFNAIKKDDLNSFLLDITVEILATKDNLSDGYLVENIQDKAGAKGTGAWTVQTALDFGVAVPTISAAVFARTMSARNQSFEVLEAKAFNKKEIDIDKEQLQLIAYNVLKVVYTVSYLQGLDLIFQVNKEKNWNIDLTEVVRIWQGGCIIRSEMLKTLAHYFNKKEVFNQLSEINNENKIWSQWQNLSKNIPTPVIHSVQDYNQTLASKQLGTNLIQAQRDFFGAHTYQRTDKEGTFTGGWKNVTD